VSKEKESVTLGSGAEFVGFSGIQQSEVRVSDAEIVFVGYGIVAPEQGWDDYKGADVSGKVLLMLNNDPSPEDAGVFGGKARTYYGRWSYKYEIAAAKGAVGAIIIHTTESAGYGWNVVESSWSGGRAELRLVSGMRPLPFKAWMTFESTQRVLELAGTTFESLNRAAQSRSFTPRPLGVTASISLHNMIRPIESANVIGILHGRDSLLSKEAVFMSAHHDHLGIGKPVDGDSIYNGAVDNATGVSALLNIARTFSEMKQRPRRSIVFAALAAEESGLIGSRYYTENPTFPPGKIAANINIDGTNVFGRTHDLTLIGFGKSSIDQLAQSVAAWQGRIVKPDQFPEQGSFYRSDQFNFARIGVPCMYLKPGLAFVGKSPGFGKERHDEYIQLNYHQPSDTIRSDWDLRGAVQDIQIMFLVGLTIANSDSMPVWIKGDEFEAARSKALHVR
jgi:Zn-dependent M28 family amino/carboxypeptidase